MKALVTGGAGFIGSNVVKYLLEKTWDVRILDNLSSGCEHNLAELDLEMIQGIYAIPKLHGSPVKELMSFFIWLLVLADKNRWTIRYSIPARIC